MKKPYTFFWLDDQVNKVDDMRSVLETGIPENELSSTVHFREMTIDAIKNLEQVAKDIRSSKADMIIIDHIFNQTDPLNTKGSSVAHLLRSAFPSTPIVCVSAAWGASAPKASFDQEDLSEYTYIFPYLQLADELELLYAIAEGFKRCADFVEAGAASIFASSLLEAPEMELASLEKILPAEFRSFEQRTTPHRIARWILRAFMAHPGYLYNDIRAATLIGLNLEGFNKVKDQFSASLYKGVFATDGRPLWWVAGLHDQLAQLAPADAPNVTQLAGRQLEGITEGDYSKCWVCGCSNPPPDVVAYPDANSSEEVAVQGMYAKLFPADLGGIPGFESRLVLTKKR